MPIPLQLTFVGMVAMPSVGLLIAEHANRLERFAASLIRCHVIVGLERRHDRRGRRYSVDLEISTPLGSIAVSQDPDAAPRGLDEMIRQAFEAAARELHADANGRSGSVAAPVDEAERAATSAIVPPRRSEGGPHTAGFERRGPSIEECAWPLMTSRRSML